MIRALGRPVRTHQIEAWLIIAGVLALAFLLGRRASLLWLGLLAVGIGGVVLLARPVLGLLVLVLIDLTVRLEINTGSAVTLNAISLYIPVLLVLWVLDMVRQRQVRLVPSATNRPLYLFLVASLLSLLIGRATWDPAVPMRSNFLLVQLSQWAIFALSAGAFWLTENLIKDETWLRRLVWFFLLAGGGLAILRNLPEGGNLVAPFTPPAFMPALWMLLTAVATGQLLYNRDLSLPRRVFLLAVVGACVAHTFVQRSETVSNWLGMAVVFGTLFWLRFPRLRWPVVILLIGLAASGVLGPAIYEFAGGDAEWDESGGSRLVLIERVIEMTMRNPITGLGPAAYRPYTSIEPLLYGRAYWIAPQINSHNNYVDLFAHGGILGLLLFSWFAWTVARLGLNLRKRYPADFAAGYVNGMLAVGASALVIMMLGDWILPFVYNLGFVGFHASVLVWLFMGGLVALENMSDEETK